MRRLRYKLSLRQRQRLAKAPWIGFLFFARDGFEEVRGKGDLRTAAHAQRLNSTACAAFRAGPVE